MKKLVKIIEKLYRSFNGRSFIFIHDLDNIEEVELLFIPKNITNVLNVQNLLVDRKIFTKEGRYYFKNQEGVQVEIPCTDYKPINLEESLGYYLVIRKVDDNIYLLIHFVRLYTSFSGGKYITKEEDLLNG
jgi:hypothetical protein